MTSSLGITINVNGLNSSTRISKLQNDTVRCHKYTNLKHMNNTTYCLWICLCIVKVQKGHHFQGEVPQAGNKNGFGEGYEWNIEITVKDLVSKNKKDKANLAKH